MSRNFSRLGGDASPYPPPPDLLMRAAAVLLCGSSLILSAFAADVGNVRVELKDAKGAPVPDAVASLIPLDRTADVTPPATPILIAQDGQEFTPYVTPVVVGTRVTFPNRDEVQHHVYSLSKTKKFDIPLFRGEPKESVRFDQPGVVSLGCNIHDWMSAYVVVLATPHFAQSAGEGIAAISGLPAGRYRLEIWHPRIKTVVQRELTVPPNDTAMQVISVTLGVDRRIRRAPEGGAGGYK
jgi:plastocyanin